MTSAPAAFYDQLLDDPANAYARSLSASPYLDLYRRASDLIPAGATVVDLGCGPGHFAQLLNDRNDIAGYTGIDFAPGLISAAVETTGRPDWFRCADLRDSEIPPGDFYVALEVLEHLDDDLALISRLAPGATLVFSVPSFPSASHVRQFPHPAAAVARYQTAVWLESWQRVPLNERGFFHLLTGQVS